MVARDLRQSGHADALREILSGPHFFGSSDSHMEPVDVQCTYSAPDRYDVKWTVVIAGKRKRVAFQFDGRNDTPEAVVTEMSGSLENAFVDNDRAAAMLDRQLNACRFWYELRQLDAYIPVGDRQLRFNESTLTLTVDGKPVKREWHRDMPIQEWLHRVVARPRQFELDDEDE